MRDLSLGGLGLEEGVKLLGLSVGRVRELNRSALGDHLLRGVGAHETLEAVTLVTSTAKSQRKSRVRNERGQLGSP